MAASWETIKVDGSDMRMYVSIPDGPGPFPAVLVSQHGPGVNEFIQDIANNLAKEGYVACAPELYHRVTEEMLTDGSSAGQHITDPGIIADISGTVEFLRSHPAVNHERLGVTGFCQGGRTTASTLGERPKRRQLRNWRCKCLSRLTLLMTINP